MKRSDYSVKELAVLSGVSIRTLHHYDKIDLLKPSVRKESGYRRYSQKELLQMQQILFYKELDFTLREISEIINKPDFDLLKSLEQHQQLLQKKKDRIIALIQTIDKTILHLKNEKIMLTPEELYEGLPKEMAFEYRKEAIEKFGKDKVEHSESSLRKLRKPELEALIKAQKENMEKLLSLIKEPPHSSEVQMEIARHYAIIRKFWGTEGSEDKQAEAYTGLGQLYIKDERYTLQDGKANPEFSRFLSKAMEFFASKL